MFLRSTLVKSGDKKIRYWKLVENYHTERGTRQRVVAHLGSVENFTSEDWRRLAERLGEPEMAAALEHRVKNVHCGRPGTRQAPYEPEDVWKGYMTLTRVEATFRSLKQELRLRPVFHRKGGRVEAHILLSYIAYVLLWCIEHVHRSHGGTLTGRRVLDVLSGIELATIRLRAGDGRKIALERISSPRPEEAQVLDTLGVRLPRKPRADKPPDLQLSLTDSGDQFCQ